jgi:hypothetical protein
VSSRSTFPSERARNTFFVTVSVKGIRAVKLRAFPSHFTCLTSNFSPSDRQKPEGSHTSTKP